jgi:flagella basal body P-ring formation protein FlgA
LYSLSDCVTKFAQFVTVLQGEVKPRTIHALISFLGGALIAAGTAPAAPPPSITAASTAATGQPSLSASPELVAEIAQKVSPLLADGVRLRSVALGCQPPAGARLDQVAPGLARLNSRGFVVEMRSDGRTLACSATLDAQRQILVAVHEIAQGEALSPADFELRWTDAFGGSMDAINSLPPRGPFLAANAIHAGDPLLAIELARPLAVHPGDFVMVVVKNGPVTVRTQLEARSAAAVGDSVAVINPETGLPVTVTITGEKSAEMLMQ